MKCSLKVIFGKEAVIKYESADSFTLDEVINNVKEFHFETKAKKNAFIRGMEISNGWTEYAIVEQE